MNIILRNEYRTEIVLSESDLADLAITYDELDYRNIETRRVLWTLLDRVRLTCGRDIDLSGKLIIEAAKEEGNTYRISFTSLPQTDENEVALRQFIRSESPAAVLEFDSLDSAVNAAAHCGFEGQSSLFVLGGKYRLVIHPARGERRAVLARLSEYGTLIPDTGRTAAAECGEHWRRIAEKNAVEKLKTLI